MEDPRSLAVISMAVQLIASGAPCYANRTLAEVAAEITGTADGIDMILLGEPETVH